MAIQHVISRISDQPRLHSDIDWDALLRTLIIPEPQEYGVAERLDGFLDGFDFHHLTDEGIWILCDPGTGFIIQTGRAVAARCQLAINIVSEFDGPEHIFVLASALIESHDNHILCDLLLALNPVVCWLLAGDVEGGSSLEDYTLAASIDDAAEMLTRITRQDRR